MIHHTKTYRQSKIFILDKANMKKTLQEYIDPENIPTQYGGKLDYKFGDLPNLDPVIQKTLTWSAPAKDKGRDTFPTGPIKWQKYENGDFAAIAVGSSHGKARDTKIATLRPAANVAQTSLGAGNQRHQLFRTTTGIDTHPPSPPAGHIEPSEPLRTGSSDSESSGPHEPYERPAAPATSSAGAGSAGAASTRSPGVEPAGAGPRSVEPTGAGPRIVEPTGAGFAGASVAGTGATGGTYLNYHDLDLDAPSASSSSQGQAPQSSYTGSTSTNLPYRPAQSASSGSDDFQDSQTHYPSTDRQGTSSTRYSGQGDTHAHGNAREGTPTTKGSHGDTYHVMEPNTVGQAPKEHPLPPTEEPPTPSYLDQAKAVAGQAYGTAASVGSSALAAVGLGGHKTEEATESRDESPRADPKVDAADASQIEEFLRSRNESGTNAGKEAAEKM